MKLKYKQDFLKLLHKLKTKENFAYTRFSDGEICIMQNKELKLADDHVVMGEIRYNFGYSKDDHKHYNPDTDGFLKNKLIQAYLYKKKNYFVGGICKGCTCASQQFAPWMHQLYGDLDDNLTSTNLLVNSNYPLFIKQMIPELKKKKIVLICSLKANLEKVGLDIVKDFRVGLNCIINDHYLVDDIKQWMTQENIKNHVFLFSASSLSEVLIYELFKFDEENTYIDIGTTIHPYIGLTAERDYLRAYWGKKPHPDLFKSCV